MPDFASVKEYDLSGQYVVVAGGTQGIGAALGLLSARLGANVAITGRNAALGNGLLEKLIAQGKDKTAKHIFLAGDLSTVKGMKETARAVKDWVGQGKVDYLFMAQGEAPSLTSPITEDGVTRYFALRVLSRFVIPYELIELGALTNGTVVSIAAAGAGDDKVDLNNLDGRGLSFVASMSYSGAVNDIITKEFNIRYPGVRTLHTFPGLVRTNYMENPSVAWWVRWLWNIVLWIPYLSRSPDEYAPVGLWIAASDEAKKKDVYFWNDKGNGVGYSKAADDDAVREQVWQKMLSWTNATS